MVHLYRTSYHIWGELMERDTVFNMSARKVGGIWFLKIGRFCFSFCLCRGYRAL